MDRLPPPPGVEPRVRGARPGLLNNPRFFTSPPSSLTPLSSLPSAMSQRNSIEPYLGDHQLYGTPSAGAISARTVTLGGMTSPPMATPPTVQQLSSSYMMVPPQEMPRSASSQSHFSFPSHRSTLLSRPLPTAPVAPPIPQMSFQPMSQPNHQSWLPERMKPHQFSDNDKLSASGKNFYAWRDIQIRYLRCNDWYGHAMGTTFKPDPLVNPMAYHTWMKINELTGMQMAINMDFMLYHQLNRNTRSAAELWTNICSQFKLMSITALADASERLRNKKIQTGELMREHVDALRKLRDEYMDCGGEMRDEEFRIIIVRSLSTHPVWQREMSLGNYIRSSEEFIAQLCLLETQRLGNTRKSEGALNTTQSGQSRRTTCQARERPTCPNCRKMGHTIENCWAPGGGGISRRPPNYKVPAEFVSKERANLLVQLAQLDGERTESASIEEVQITRSPSPPEHAQVAKITLDCALVSTELGLSKSCWLLDSGASSHMTNNRDHFKVYESIQPIVILTAKWDVTLLAIGRGTIIAHFKLKSKEYEVPVHNVLHVPELTFNLVSLAKLDKKGVEFHSRDGRCYLLYKDLIFGGGTRVDDQWLMDMKIPHQIANIVVNREDIRKSAHVWHQHLAHMGTAHIKELVRLNVIRDVQISVEVHDQRCESCVISKLATSHAELKDLRAKAPGDVIHANLEFLGHRSFGGSEISLKFLDEFSNYLWVYAITSKEAHVILTHWSNLCAEFRTQFNRTIKALHTDNGTEFCNTGMKEFNEQNGIHHHTTVPYRHEMNGRIERMNRTGADAVRAMLHSAGLPPAYWAEAYQTFTYIHNRTAQSADPAVTPFEVLFHRKPSLAHVCIFGCSSYTRTPPERHSKLEPKARKLLLMGYKEDACYRLIDPVSHKVEYSRDVVFDEFKSFHQPLPIPVDTVTRPPTPPLRRSERIAAIEATNLSQSISSVPKSASEAFRSPNADEWHTAMVYETGKLTEMGCWDVVERPSDVHVIKGMWVFAQKEQADGSVNFRARWVARGDSQIPGLEFNETFAAVGDFRTAKIIMAISSHPNATLLTVDINSAYLHSPLQEDNLYVEYPSGFKPSGFSSPVCHLKKALYSLRQGARAWSSHLNETMDAISFKRCVTAPSVFVRSDESGETILATHVDDLNGACISSSSAPRSTEADRFKSQLAAKFQFKEKDASQRANILGMTVSYDLSTNRIKLSIEQKILRALERYGLSKCNPVQTPMDKNIFQILDDDISVAPDPTPWPYSHLIGELLWISSIVRIDIAFAVNTLTRFARQPKQVHWDAAKRILRYLAGTPQLGLIYYTAADMRPIGYSDSDWAGDRSDRKSVSGFVFFIGGGPVIWQSKKQTVVAKSTAEAEYIAVSSATCKAIWLRHFFSEINRPFVNLPLLIHVDNESAVEVARDPVYVSRTKHIDIQVHHIRDEVRKGRISLVHVPSTLNPADILTKPLGTQDHWHCISLLNMS